MALTLGRPLWSEESAQLCATLASQREIRLYNNRLLPPKNQGCLQPKENSQAKAYIFERHRQKRNFGICATLSFLEIYLYNNRPLLLNFRVEAYIFDKHTQKKFRIPLYYSEPDHVLFQQESEQITHHHHHHHRDYRSSCYPNHSDVVRNFLLNCFFKRHPSITIKLDVYSGI